MLPLQVPVPGTHTTQPYPLTQGSDGILLWQSYVVSVPLLQSYSTVPVHVIPFGEQGIDPSPPLLLVLPPLPEDESGVVKTSGKAMSSVASLGPLLLPPLLLVLLPELEPLLLLAPELLPEAPLLLLEAPSPFSPPSVNPPLFVLLPPPQAATIAARDVAGQAQESQLRTKLWWHRPLPNQRKDAM